MLLNYGVLSITMEYRYMHAYGCTYLSHEYVRVLIKVHRFLYLDTTVLTQWPTNVLGVWGNNTN